LRVEAPSPDTPTVNYLFKVSRHHLKTGYVYQHVNAPAVICGPVNFPEPTPIVESKLSLEYRVTALFKPLTDPARMLTRSLIDFAWSQSQDLFK